MMTPSREFNTSGLSEKEFAKMKAIRIHRRDDLNVLVYEDVPQPQPGDGEVLVRVYASGVTPAELGWGATWKTKAGVERQFPIPGHELSGIVAQVGTGVTEVKVGDAVYGFNDFDQDGSEAEYTLTRPAELALKAVLTDSRSSGGSAALRVNCVASPVRSRWTCLPDRLCSFTAQRAVSAVLRCSLRTGRKRR